MLEIFIFGSSGYNLWKTSSVHFLKEESVHCLSAKTCNRKRKFDLENKVHWGKKKTVCIFLVIEAFFVLLLHRTGQDSRTIVHRYPFSNSNPIHAPWLRIRVSMGVVSVQLTYGSVRKSYPILFRRNKQKKTLRKTNLGLLALCWVHYTEITVWHSDSEGQLRRL